MNRADFHAVVTYEGDIRQPLPDCGSERPCRLNAEGNTEQDVPIRGLQGAKHEDVVRLSDLLEPLLLDDCSRNAKVVGIGWIEKKVQQ